MTPKIITLDFSMPMCITHPNLKMNYYLHDSGSITHYATHDLSGICSCGKPYSEHPHFVEENRKTKEEIEKL